MKNLVEKKGKGVLGLFCCTVVVFFSCCNSKNKIAFNVSYSIDTFKVDLKRYVYETDSELDWYAVTALYPFFESDTLPDILKQYNQDIEGLVDSLSFLPIKDFYNSQFDESYFSVRYGKTYKGTLEERVADFIIDIENNYEWDTLELNLEPSVYVSEDYVSVRIEGKNWKGLPDTFPPEDYVYCFNVLLNEDKLLGTKDCFELKKPIDEWKEYLFQELGGYVKPDFLNHPDSLYFPIKFHKQMEDLFDFYFFNEYGPDYAISMGAKEIEQFFHVKQPIVLGEKKEGE